MNETPDRPLRIALVDDQPLVRAGFAMVIDSQDDMEVILQASDGAEAVSALRARSVDVVLMDVRMPRKDGIEATAEILAQAPEDRAPKVIVLTTFDLDEYVFGALRAGAAGFLLKTADAATLLDAVRRVAAGEGVLAPEVTRRLLTAFAQAPEQTDPAMPEDVATLTDREREVLTGLGQGLSNAGLAQALDISEATAKTHVSRVLAKLGCSSRVQAAIRAREAGLA